MRAICLLCLIPLQVFLSTACNAAHRDPSERPVTHTDAPQSARQDHSEEIFRTNVFDLPRDAKCVIFVCDARGGMLPVMEPFKVGLQNCIRELSTTARFNIIFYHDGWKEGAQYKALSNTEALLATEENRNKAERFLDDVYSGGPCDPIPALSLAFSQHPDLIQFMMRGPFYFDRTSKELTDFFPLIDPVRRVRINTVLYDYHVKESEDVLRTLAKQTGGTYRFVTAEEANPPDPRLEYFLPEMKY